MPCVETIVGKLQRKLADLRTDARGNVAILFGLTLIPVAGLAGAALDYNRALEFRTFMHGQTDSAALAIASADTPNAEGVMAALKTTLASHFGAGSSMVSDVTATGAWVGSSDYTLTMSAKLTMTLVSVVPGAPRQIPISVRTTVKRKPAEWQWSLPTIKELSNEAWDYNRISVYCYDESKKNEANKGRRLETLTPIADNYGTNYSGATLPSCLPGETLSFKLWNVRNGKEPGKPNNLKWWQKNASGQDPEKVPSARNDAATDYYSFYTDTTIDPNSRVVVNKVWGGMENASGVVTTITDMVANPMLETMLCTTNVDCKPKNQGGILPNNGEFNKTPVTATAACSEGKSMYYGWEDRPPTGGSDKDYDDIRIVVSCPTLVKISDKEVRIIQ